VKQNIKKLILTGVLFSVMAFVICIIGGQQVSANEIQFAPVIRATSSDAERNERSTVETTEDEVKTEDIAKTETTQKKDEHKTEAVEKNESNDKEDKDEDNSIKSFIKKYFWFLIGGVLVLIGLIIITIMLLLKDGGSKKKTTTLKGGKDEKIRTRNGELNPGSNITMAPKARIGVPITLDIISGEIHLGTRTEFINRSAIVGRSENCEIRIEDETISRQHFAIEYRDGSFYIQDLETTNGTYLNGVRLTHKRRIVKNDKIKAGALEIIVRW